MAEETNLWKKFEEEQLYELAAEIIDEDAFEPGETPIDTDISVVRIMLEGINPAKATPEQRSKLVKLLRAHLTRFA